MHVDEQVSHIRFSCVLDAAIPAHAAPPFRRSNDELRGLRLHAISLHSRSNQIDHIAANIEFSIQCEIFFQEAVASHRWVSYTNQTS